MRLDEDVDTGERNTGPAELSPEQLEKNRVDYPGNILAHPLDDAWYREPSPDVAKVGVPALVVANWGGLGLHLRGTIQGYLHIHPASSLAACPPATPPSRRSR